MQKYEEMGFTQWVLFNLTFNKRIWKDNDKNDNNNNNEIWEFFAYVGVSQRHTQLGERGFLS